MVDVVSFGDHHNFALLKTKKGNEETAKVIFNAWGRFSQDIQQATPNAQGEKAEVVDNIRSICLGEPENPWTRRCMIQKQAWKGGGKALRKSG